MNEPKPIEAATRGGSCAPAPLLGHGSKFKIIITLDAELATETGGVTEDQICELMLRDDAYGLKSIVAGKINPDSKDEHDTEIIWNRTTVEVA